MLKTMLQKMLQKNLPSNYSYNPLPKFLTIKPSAINGLGVFSTRMIVEGVIIGETHYADENNNLLIRTPLGGFINHSLDPNCKLVKGSNNFYFLKTIKDIMPDDEILVNYMGEDEKKLLDFIIKLGT